MWQIGHISLICAVYNQMFIAKSIAILLHYRLKFQGFISHKQLMK